MRSPTESASSSGRLDHAAVILFADAKVEIDAEPESQGVVVRFSALDGRAVLPVQEADLEGINLSGRPEEVPGGRGRALVAAVGEIRGAHDLKILIGQNIEGGPDNLFAGTTTAHDEGRASREFNCGVFEGGRNEQETRLHIDGRWWYRRTGCQARPQCSGR